MTMSLENPAHMCSLYRSANWTQQLLIVKLTKVVFQRQKSKVRNEGSFRVTKGVVLVEIWTLSLMTNLYRAASIGVSLRFFAWH